MIGTIYLILNIVNGKRYIGQTTSPLAKKWNGHLAQTSRCHSLSSSIKKYGKANFKVEILEQIEDQNKTCLLDKLNILERAYINKYSTLSPNGYNLTLGGNAANLSQENIQKRANSHKKPIICVTNGKIYLSTLDAANELGLNKKSIHRVLRGERRQYNGLVFEYVGKHKPLKDENLQWKKAKPPQRTGVPFLCHQNGKTYKTLTEACTELDLRISKLSLVLNGKRKSHKNMTFSYLSQS